MTPPVDDASSKRELRAVVRSRRALLSEDQLVVGGLAITAHVLDLPEVRAARTVAAYASYGVEPRTAPLIEELTTRGVRVLLPVLLEDKDLDWREHDSDERLGLDAIAEADVVVTPALAVDSSGARLGQGGGSFDRALSRIRDGALVVALLHDGELLDAGAIPVDRWDVPVQVAVTPSGVSRLPLRRHPKEA